MIIVPIVALHHPDKNTILLSIRPEGKQLAGYHEFPGGKVEPNELPVNALCRELYEELDISVHSEDLKPVIFTEFEFESKQYLLLMYYCTNYKGIAIGKEGQKIEYVSLDQLHEYRMPEANSFLIPILKKYIQGISC